MNLGDPIQSLAVLELYKKLEIPESEIVPLDRYDLTDYAGEDVIALINGAEIYEHFAYATRFLPVSAKIHPVFISLHLHRELSESELGTLRRSQPIGCRDEYTVRYLQSKGIDAFLTGCLTMLFDKREEKPRNKVFLVDCSANAMAHIPDSIKKDAVILSQVIRMTTEAPDHRLTLAETEEYNKIAEAQLNRYRDEAKLVVTSRLHVASPCAAVGIPVVLVRDTYDERYQFIDRFLPLYYPEDLDNLDWEHISTGIPETVKETLTHIAQSMLDTAKFRLDLKNIYASKSRDFVFANEEELAVQKFPMNCGDSFAYCIWGVCLPNSFLLYEQMQRQYPNARLLYAIDTYATGIYKENIRIIHPDEIEKLVERKTWILVVAPAAHGAASEKLSGKYPFALLKGVDCRIYEQK